MGEGSKYINGRKEPARSSRYRKGDGAVAEGAAGYVDEYYQPLLSRTQAALLADAIIPVP